ncbi:MAG: hypothetical protein IIC62_03380, partial [Proteobacteria bacterium]|nr:hypothetical protein [Pseudomonadota bacterium]
MTLIIILLLCAVVTSHASELTPADYAFLAKKIIAEVEITRLSLIAETYARGIDILDHHPNPAGQVFRIVVSSTELAALES